MERTIKKRNSTFKFKDTYEEEQYQPLETEKYGDYYENLSQPELIRFIKSELAKAQAELNQDVCLSLNLYLICEYMTLRCLFVVDC